MKTLQEPHSEYLPLLRSYRAATVCVLDLEGVILKLNTQPEGPHLESILNRPMTDLVAPEDRAGVADAIRRCGSSNSSQRYLYRSYGDGATGTMHAGTLIPITENGIARILVFDFDIGPWEAQIDTFAQRNQDILQALEVAAEGIAVMHDGRYTYMNPSHANMYGFEPWELLGKSWEELYDSEERTRIQSEIFPLLMRDGRWDGVVRGCRKDKSYFEVELNLAFHEGGNLVCTCRDVTVRNELDREVRRSRDELDRLNRLKDNFLAMVSHELRTPLASVLGYSEALARGVYGELNERQHKAVQSLTFSAQYQLRLVNDLLDLSRIESNSLSLERAAYPLRVLASSANELIAGAARAKGVRIHYMESEGAALVHVDRTRMVQVLVNLLNNAVKYSRNDSIVELHVESASESTHVQARIVDHGPGISPQDLERLFEPFFRGEVATKTQDGAGLGLPLAKRLVELQGGRISVLSHPGRGTTVTVTLPRHTAPVPAAPLDSSTPSSTARSSLQNKRHILLVEDSVELAELLTDFLVCENCEVVWVASGETVLGQLRQQPFDLVILDGQLPGKSGLTVVQELRQDEDPAIAGIPVLALTAHAMAEDKKRFLAAGASSYLGKPVSLANLIAAIEQLVPLP
jgi:PAS domain S-box-containing protein